MPGLADALPADALPASHSTWKSAEVSYSGPRLEDNTPAGSPGSCFGRPATKSQITVVCTCQYKKDYKLSSECVQGLVGVLVSW